MAGRVHPSELCVAVCSRQTLSRNIVRATSGTQSHEKATGRIWLAVEHHVSTASVRKFFMASALSLASVLVCLALAGLSHALVDVGECPTFSPVAEFDLEQYFGRWYEIHRFENFEEGLSCAGADYGPGPEANSFSIHDFGIAEDGSEAHFMFEGLLTDVPGELEIVNPGGDNGFNYVLGTDYTTHSCVYRCTQDGELRDQLAWILSPTEEMDPAILEAALGIFEANGVDTSLFLPATVQGGDCTYPTEGTPPPPQ